VKTVVILLETQRLLAQLIPPCIDEISSISSNGFFHPVTIFANLHHVALIITSSTISNSVITGVLPRLASCRELYLNLPSSSAVRQRTLPLLLLRAWPFQSCLLSRATRMTIQGYHFHYRTSGPRKIPMPCLDALAVLDCFNVILLFDDFQAVCFSQLSALMTRDQELFMSTQFEEFLRDIRSVRELIQCGGHVLITDLNMIGRHADTLEVLAVTRKPSCYERSPSVAEDEDITALFNSLTRASDTGTLLHWPFR
jgi:hypothetical protein